MRLKRLTAFMLAFVLASSAFMTGCGDDEDEYEALLAEETDDDQDSESEAYGEDGEDSDDLISITKVEDSSLQIFIGEPFYDGTVEDEDEALNVMYELVDYLCDDDSIELELDAVDGPTEQGNTFYTFHQMAGTYKVQGASAKLVTDKDGYPIGFNSTLSMGIESINAVDWQIDKEEAEYIVENGLKEAGYDCRLIPGTTEQILLPDEEDPSIYHYVWAVYTTNTDDKADTAYLVHYIDSKGEYLYFSPVTSPGDTSEMSEAGALFSFEGLVADTWTGTVTKYHGETETVTIPVAKDPQTGDVYLADVDRKIMCADYFKYEYDDTIEPRAMKNGKFADNEVITYHAMTEIYDFYDSIGWRGSDGDGSPIMLLMDWVDPDGEPVHNACYSGKQRGFDVFQFNRDEPDGETYDIMAHEFTHGLTTATMITNLYMNDYGAINEAMSDIFGNLVEAILKKTDDTTWMIAEMGMFPIRSMSEPHEYDQPEFVWDLYYVPAAGRPSMDNDNGGVHTNSSLLNLIAYKLNESGMDPYDQLDYWRNVAFILTPRTDYETLAVILPWTLKLVGHDEYMDVLMDAIRQSGIADKTLPDSVPDDLASFRMDLSGIEAYEGYDAYVAAYSPDYESAYVTWPENETDMIAVTVRPGTYYFHILLENEEKEEKIMLTKTKDGWSAATYEEPELNADDPDKEITVSYGDVMVITPPDFSQYLSK